MMYGFPTLPPFPREQIDPNPRFVPAPFAGGDAGLSAVQVRSPAGSFDAVSRCLPNDGSNLGSGTFGINPFGSNGFGLGSIFSAFAALIQNMFALIAQSIGRLGPQFVRTPLNGWASISTNGCPPAFPADGSTRGDGNRPVSGAGGDGTAGVELYGP